MKKMSKKMVPVAVMIIIAVIMASCVRSPGESNVSDGTSDTSRAELQKVTLVLDWVVNTNHTGIFVAKELGYFEDEGLDVEIVQAPDMNFIEMVGVDSAQIGICGQEQLTQARVTGNVPVVAIGAILQENTSGFASPVDRNIKSPADFEGRRYSGWGTPLEEKFIENMMDKVGADFTKVEMRMMAATDYFASMETEADFAWIYYGWDGIGAQARNYPIDFILLQDIDPAMNFYSPVIISNEKTIENDPEMLTKFMKAVAKGHKYTIDNIEEACDLLLRSTPETDRAHALASIEYLSEFFLNDNGEFGFMKRSVWDDFSRWMLDNELIEAPLDIDEAFTNAFLYGEYEVNE